jgi:molybdopterin converting factor subunit 1
MKVRVLFFAVAREAAGTPEVEVVLPEDAKLSHAREEIARRFPALKERLRHFRFAVDREFSPLDTALHEGAEVAVIPPVSGG